MPFAEHRFVKSPPGDTVIWRYLDLAKFVSMLQTQGLYFTRADLAGDNFEGSYTSGNRAFYERWFRDLYGKEAGAQWVARVSEFNRGLPKWMHLNCWHVNETESAAMWHLYGLAGQTIAIKTKVEGLIRHCVEGAKQPIHVGFVNYIDYGHEKFPDAHPIHAFLHKRKSFEHEREVRAIIVSYEAQKEPFKLPAGEGATGIVVGADLDRLIGDIYVAPRSPAWLREVIEGLAREYGVGASVHHSSLDKDPIF